MPRKQQRHDLIPQLLGGHPRAGGGVARRQQQRQEVAVVPFLLAARLDMVPDQAVQAGERTV